jgi:hypothetical protein
LVLAAQAQALAVAKLQVDWQWLIQVGAQV